MQLYVGNLDYNISEDDLRELFSGFGEIASVVIIKDRETGRSKGFGFVEMPKQTEARAAVDGLNGTDFQGRKIEVNEARPRTERPRNDSRPRNGGNSSYPPRRNSGY